MSSYVYQSICIYAYQIFDAPKEFARGPKIICQGLQDYDRGPLEGTFAPKALATPRHPPSRTHTVIHTINLTTYPQD